MAKKQKKVIPKPALTKRQLSKWQRQMKIRRIVIIAAVVFLAGILSWVGYGYYKDRVEPWREVVIEVNGIPFTMEYYFKILDGYTAWMDPSILLTQGDIVANNIADHIIRTELFTQEATNWSIEVTAPEISARLTEAELPDNEAYRDIIRAALLQEKLEEYFGSQLPDTLKQAHVQVMLVESEEVADEVMAKVEAGSNFTALVAEFSCNSSIEGDLGWLPEELMLNTSIANAAFNLTVGEISQPIYDVTAIKNIGYWLIEVIGKQDDEIKARAMLMGSEAEAERVKAELVSRNFSSLAREYSQHKSKDEGGELGWLKKGKMGSGAFDKIAFNITVNEVSEPVKDESVQTSGGYWLTKVVDRGDHELEAKVKERLIEKHFNDWFEEWKANSTIENLLDKEKRAWAIRQILMGR